MTSHSEIREAMRSAVARHGKALGSEITDEMAVPSYLERGIISRAVFWRKLHHILRGAALKPNTRVFDFGCGTGVLLPTLSAEGRQVLATDIHLELARDLVRQLDLTRVELVAADTWRDRVPDGQIETIVAANVLEHIDDRREVLASLANKLTPTGRLVISGPSENTLYRFGRRLMGFSGHYHVTTVRHVIEDALGAGLEQLYVRRWPLPGFMCLYQIAAFRRC